MEETVTMAHGSGGLAYQRLVAEVFLPAFANNMLTPLGDAAICAAHSGKLAFTTDSFVVRPRFFPGGDIGRLAVCGTVNDIAMSGATPAYLSVGMILEAGFSLAELRLIVASMAQAAQEANVAIVTGDTKVVEAGSCDGIFINTAGVGLFTREPLAVHPAVGDMILVSGGLAEHGLSVLAARQGFDFQPALVSDVAPLASLAACLLEAAPQTSCLRDPTRGGVAATLHEWAQSAGATITVEEAQLPLKQAVSAACALLGMDALYVANEGKLLAAVPENQAQAALAALHRHPLGREAAIIGRVGQAQTGMPVLLRTAYGGERLLDIPTGELLPRIC